MNRKLLLSPLFLFLILFSVNLVSATDGQDIDLTNFPSALANRFNISSYAGGILATIIVAVAFLLPVALYTKTFVPPLIVGIFISGFAIAVGWLDIFFMLIWVLLVAMLAGFNFKKWIGG